MIVPVNRPTNPICAHEHRNQYLGGGLWVCFACWARLLLGGRK